MGLLELSSHIENFDARHGTARNPFGEFHQFILSLLRIPVGFKRRCRRAQQYGNTLPASPHNGHIPAVIPWLLLLLVARIMLLVDHDQSQVPHRCQRSRARAHHQSSLAASNPPPFALPLPVAQAAVKKRHHAGKSGGKQHLNRRCQSDFRHQHQRRAALC